MKREKLEREKKKEKKKKRSFISNQRCWGPSLGLVTERRELGKR